MRGQLFRYSLFFSFSIVLFQFSFAQQPINYDKEWKNVDSLFRQKGLTQSALAVVNNIYSAAKKDKNEPQRIKSLLYMMTLQQEKQENTEVKNIQLIDKEVNASSGASRAILTSMLADTYLYYLQQHRYQLYGR